MEPVIIVEVLERSYKVRERVRLTQFPATIGRAYDNAVILDDDFVAPRHALIELDEAGQLNLRDLETENGTLTMPGLAPIQCLRLGDDTLVRMGRSLLRLRSPQLTVKPALLDSVRRSRLGQLLTKSRAVLGLAFAALFMVGFAEYQASLPPDDGVKLLLQTLELAAIVPIWAGLWALLARLFTHHTEFLAHVAIGCLAILGYLAIDTVADYYAFAFSADLSADLVFYGLLGTMAAWVLYGHMRFSTLLSPRRIAWVAAGLSAGALAFSGLVAYVQSQEFNDALPYAPEVKPDTFRIAPAKSIEQFIKEATPIAPDEP